MGLAAEILGNRTDNTLARLKQADLLWQKLREGDIYSPQAVIKTEKSLDKCDFDVIICGGTLGILIAAALQNLGWRVGLIEKGVLRGREQEWNISREELQTFLELNLLTKTELETAIVTEYNPARVSFLGGKDIWIKDILNIGIDPVYLLENLKQKFLAAGGKLWENTAFQSVTIYPNGAEIKVGKTSYKTRLVIDAMGHFSPIVAQARKEEKPDGICLVVGSCATGFTENKTGDLIVSFTPIKNQCQYFWEAFPAKDGRTTYMFTYVDIDKQRPSLEFFMDEYLELLPEYQSIELSQLDFKRFLFGFFPAYKNSPLHLPFDRILPIGDSSASQSPVSFGGFGAMVRHLKRLTYAIDEALKIDKLDQKNLALLQPYQPNISVTWLFQKTMSVPINAKPQPNQINDLMNEVFKVMEKLGEPVIKPFLQDVIQFIPLTKTLLLVNPKFVLPLLPQIGILALLDWSKHYLLLGLYTALYPLGKSLQPLAKNLSPQTQFVYHRWLEAWQYGAGKD